MIREDSRFPLLAGQILRAAPATRPGEGGPGEMADVAYVLVFAGGFTLLALMLRGLERL